MKTLATVMSVILLFVALAAAGSALNLITIPWLTFDSKVNANRGIVSQTFNANNELYNYHWFQERAGAITALAQTIDQSKAALASFEAEAGPHTGWTFEDKTEDARLRAVMQGQQAQYNSLVNEYNARAGEADRSMFVNGLPTFFTLQ